MNAMQKVKAVELMCRLGLSIDIIKDFINDDKVRVFEEFGNYEATENAEVVEKIKEREEAGDIVYAVTHEIAPFGELYDFFVVPKYEEDWKYLIGKVQVAATKDITTIFAYVWNKTDEPRSEYGSIVAECYWTNLRRVI